MNRDDINKMWLQSQDDAEGMRLGFTTQQHYFAALVAAHEREACVRECENHRIEDFENDGEPLISAVALECAEAIRKRGDV